MFTVPVYLAVPQSVPPPPSHHPPTYHSGTEDDYLWQQILYAVPVHQYPSPAHKKQPYTVKDVTSRNNQIITTRHCSTGPVQA